MVWSNQAPTEITFPPGAHDGARIVINETGLIVYDSLNRLVTSISWESFTDQYGNTIQTGTTIGSQSAGYLFFVDEPSDIIEGSITGYNNGGDPGLNIMGASSSHPLMSPPTMHLYIDSNTQYSIIEGDATRFYFNAIDPNNAPNMAYINLDADTQVIVLKPVSTDNIGQLTLNNSGFQFSSGLAGGYYYEQVLIPTTSLPTSTIVTLSNFTSQQLFSDYGSAFNLVSGLWTCPVSAVYDITFMVATLTGITGRFAQLVHNNTTTNYILGTEPGGSSSSIQTLSGSCYIEAGDKISFFVEQSSGTTISLGNNPNADSYISIGRRL